MSLLGGALFSVEGLLGGIEEKTRHVAILGHILIEMVTVQLVPDQQPWNIWVASFVYTQSIMF